MFLIEFSWEFPKFEIDLWPAAIAHQDDDDGSSLMSSQRGNPPTLESDVENLTRYSPRSRRWSKRGLLESRVAILSWKVTLSSLN